MLTWLKGYRRELLAGDLGAGVLVVLMLVPQGMAYALVAGLPPVAGQVTVGVRTGQPARPGDRTGAEQRDDDNDAGRQDR